MPTSRLAAAALWLAGCTPGMALKPGATVVQVASDVTIAGPDGYCVDDRSAENRLGGAFVMLGSCAALQGEGGPEAPAVLTALVSPPSDPPLAPSAEQLLGFLNSPDGRAALAHDGRAGSVSVLSSRADDGVLYVRVRDSSADRPEGLEPVSWRAVFGLDSRLVALAASSHGAAPASDAELQGTLERFVQAVRAANAASRAGAR